MKFIVDAQLPKSLSQWLKANNHDSIHTIELPSSNATDDKTVRKICSSESRILITKDTDFENSFLLYGEPEKLLLVTTGNISNKELLHLFSGVLNHLLSLFNEHSFLELSRDKIIVRM